MAKRGRPRKRVIPVVGFSRGSGKTRYGGYKGRSTSVGRKRSSRMRKISRRR